MLINLSIFSGCFKNKKIYYKSSLKLRPVSNIVRKILFNWINSFTREAIILDLFTGSGILSFESISRKSKKSLMIDNSDVVYKYINKNAFTLNIKSKVCCIYDDVYSWLVVNNFLNFDLIFLDPPYKNYNLLLKCFFLINNLFFLNSNIIIYIESENYNFYKKVPYNWVLIHKKSFGKINCFLFRKLL